MIAPQKRNEDRLNTLATPKMNHKASPVRYLPSYYQRYKTESKYSNSAISNNLPSLPRHASTTERTARKQFSIGRQSDQKKSIEKSRFKIQNGEISVSLKRKPFFSLESFDGKLVKIPSLKVKMGTLKQSDFQTNFMNLLRIWESLLQKKGNSSLIQNVKSYVLEEESDMNQLQQCFEGLRERQLVKSILYQQRVVVILIVESLLNKRFRFNQASFCQLFKELLRFYSIIYLHLTEKTVDKICGTSDELKEVLSFLPQSSVFDLTLTKANINKIFQTILKQFGDLQTFVNQQSQHLKNYPTNLLYYNLLEFYAGKLTAGEWTKWGIQFLQTCPSPYIHYPAQKRYTLLLDLDETLVHYKTIGGKGEFLLRPNLFSFLSLLQPHYELGVFTCGVQSYADLILSHFPMIKIKLYRQHAVKIGGSLVKDLSRVGRSLQKLILVDNLDKNFQLQPQNGIHVRSWYGDKKDDILLGLGKELVKLSAANLTDIRKSNHCRSFL